MQSHAYAEPLISKDSRPEEESALESVQEYMRQTAWEHEVVSSWFKSVDPSKWQEYHDSYQGLNGELGHLYQGANGCQSSQALIINMAVGPHKDRGDVKDGWVATCCWGDFEGALAVFPDLFAKFKQEPGDILLARTAVLEHWITAITKGFRASQVWFTKANILQPDQISLRCPITNCPKGYKERSSLLRHLRNDHGLNASDAILTANKVTPRDDEAAESND